MAAGSARAADVPIAPSKLIVVDTLASKGKAKVVVVAKDGAVIKGAGTDPSSISATLQIAYDGDAGELAMPQGDNWLKNDADGAKYVNKAAPTGGSVKLSLIKVGKLLKLKAAGLGETPLDISSAPSGQVFIADTIVNAGETTRLCGQFSSCKHKSIAGGTGFKLTCKLGAPDPSCSAAPAASSTTTTFTTTTTTDTTTTSTDTTTTTADTTTTTTDTTTTTVPATTTTTEDTTTTTSDSTTTSTETTTTTTTSVTLCPTGTPVPCNTGLHGMCQFGTSVCDGQKFGPCNQNLQPSEDVCGDHLDSDCDGTADEGCVCPPNVTIGCTTGLDGVCDFGLATCSSDGKSLGPCNQAGFPEDEICGDGLDSDCDGNLDNGCP